MWLWEGLLGQGQLTESDRGLKQQSMVVVLKFLILLWVCLLIEIHSLQANEHSVALVWNFSMKLMNHKYIFK